MRRLRNLLKSVQRQLKKIRNKGIFFITLRQKDPQLRLRILFIASSSRKILNCGRGGGRFLEKNQNFFRCFQNALRKWLLIQPENGCLSLLSPCMRRLMFPFVGIQIVISSFFQSIGKAKISIFLSLSRQLLYLLPCLLLLPHWWGLNGIWLSMPVSDLLAFITACLMLAHHIKKLNKITEV